MKRAAVFMLLLSMFLQRTGSAAQQGPNTEGSIQGVVIDSETGMPVAGVDVTVEDWEAPQPITATSDDDGRFLLKGLQAGTHKIVTERDGYARARPAGRKAPGNTGIMFTVAPGQQLKGVVVKLIPGAVITGTVVDTGGLPVQDVSVIAAPKFVFEQRPLTPFLPEGIEPPIAEGATNDRGEFRLFGVDPGEYYVFIQDPAAGRADGYESVYYPGVTDLSRAHSVVVKAGEEIRLGSVALTDVKRTPIHIKIINEAGDPPQMRGIRIDGTAIFTSSRGYGGPAALEIRGLSPGRHDIALEWKTADGVAYGRRAIDVGAEDVYADLVVQKGVRVTGRALLEAANGNTRPLSGVGVEFLAVPRLMACCLSGKSGEDGAFSIGSLPPLEYRIRINGLPSGAYVIRAREGDRDILADGARISGDSTIDILIGAGGGVIEGVVRDSRGQTIQGAVVVLAPDAALRNREDLYRRADADQDGKFTLRGLPPGAFTLFAWMNVEGSAFLKSDFMKDFEERGKAVRVVRGQTMKIEVPLADDGR